MTDAPPSARSSSTSRPDAADHGLDHVAGLEGHGLDHGPGQVGPAGAPGDAEQRAAGVGIPPRAAQAGEGGHEHDAFGVGDRRGQRPDLGRVGDDAEPVAQPLHGGAGDEDGAFEGVVGDRAIAGPPSASPGSVQATVVSSPSTGSGHVSPDVHQHERAGAVGVLRHARLEAGLAEQRRLLVAGDAADRDAAADADRAVRGHAEPPARRPHLAAASSAGTPNRSHSSVDQASDRMSNSIVRLALDDVGGVHAPSPPVRFHSSHESMVPKARSASGLDAALGEQPLELGGREVRVEHQAGGGPHQRQVAGLAQLVAAGRRAPVLPHDRPVHAAGRCAGPRPRWSRAGR